jgi:CelD/BcsL family acetyltransferase involved in cellulose biosynthesis
MLDAKHYRKHVNWFSRQGTLQYHCILDPREILTHLPDFAKMHTGEWAARGQRSLYTSDESRRFHEYLIEELEPYRAVRLDILTLDHKAIAAHFGFNWNGRVYYYRPCYDHTFEDHSPGRLLLAHIIKRAVEDGASEVDLLGGMEEYKMKLSSDIRATASMQMYRGLESLPYAVLSRLGCLDN